MNNIVKFANEKFGEIRTVVINDEPWFVGKDVAVALGYESPTDAARRNVDDEDRGVAEIETPSGTQKMTIINESGLYSLILSSKLESAKEFKRWVTSEVLPSIRKYGLYATPVTIEAIIDNPDYGIQLLKALKQEREQRAALESKVIQDAPKVIFADAVTKSDTTILVGELAKILKQNGVDMGRNRLLRWLKKNEYLIKRKGTDYNMPTQYAMERGWFIIGEKTIVKPDGSVKIVKAPRITGKGQQYFVNCFLRGVK